MKTAIKVINIIIVIGAILSFFLCLFMNGVLETLAAQAQQSGDRALIMEVELLKTMYTMMEFLLPASAIVGIIGLVVLKKATTKKPLIIMGIFTLIFTNVVSGILMLALPQSAFEPKAEPCACNDCNAEPTAPFEEDKQ